MTIARLELAASLEYLELAGELATVDRPRRRISGLLVPAGDAVAMTSAGRTRIAPGSLTWTEPRRVKLLREHQAADSLGYALELEWTPEGLVGTFTVPEGPSGDRALVEAENGTRDGFSVGAAGLTTEQDGDVVVVTAGQLREVSLCSLPAYDDARVRSVAATMGRTAMTTPTTALQAAAPPPAPATDDPRAILAELRELLASVRPEAVTTGLGALAPAGAPTANGAAPAATGGPRELTLSGFAELVVGSYSGAVDPRELTAALADIVPANVPNHFIPAYLDELWDATDYVRKFIDNATTVRPLPRALKVIGHRWVNKPTVGVYAGNKTAVPSNSPVSLEAVEVNVARLAGAHDVDRAMIDLGSPDFIASYFEAQTESYRRQSDQAAATAVWNAATAITDLNGATTGEADTVMAAVVEAIVELAILGEGVEYVALAPGLVAELLGITRDQAPAYFDGSFQLGNQGDGSLGGTRWFTTPGLPTGGILVGQRSAVRYHELPTPIRVQAQNIANGGVDLGVFGYHAQYVKDSAKIRKATVS